MNPKELEEIEDRRRQQSAVRLMQVPSIAAAADKYYGLVYSHATDPDVAALTAGLALDCAVQRRRDREKDIPPAA